VVGWCSTISDSILSSGYRPDVIVGMSRGGWVPARILCDQLLVRNLVALRTQHWGVTASRDGKARLVTQISEQLEGRNVLIVDDITDTGESMRLAYEHVMSRNPEHAGTAAMLHISHSHFKPDFYSAEVAGSDWRWFIFPWNFYEDMAHFIGEVLSDGPLSIQQIVDALRSSNELIFEEKTLLTLLLHLASNGVVRKVGKKWEKLPLSSDTLQL